MFFSKNPLVNNKKQWNNKPFQNENTEQAESIMLKKMKLEMKNTMQGQNSVSSFMGDSSAQALNLGTKTGNKFFESDNITIYAWNVNGIRAMIKKKKLDEFFETVNPEIL